jgi:hypothetical protein
MFTRKRALGLGVVAAVAVAAVPALTSAQTGARDITLKLKVRGGTQVQHADDPRPGRLATGDALIIRLAVFDAGGARAGSAYTECVNVGGKSVAMRATLQCTQTYKLRDGQIVTSGLVNFSALDDLTIPIVGGSGAYRGASGELGSGPPEAGFDSIDVLHLDG